MKMTLIADGARFAAYDPLQAIAHQTVTKSRERCVLRAIPAILDTVLGCALFVRTWSNSIQRSKSLQPVVSATEERTCECVRTKFLMSAKICEVTSTISLKLPRSFCTLRMVSKSKVRTAATFSRSVPMH